MSDTNKNSQIDPDEAAGVVDEEETVNEALVNKEISDEEAGGIDSLDALEKEAQKIEMEEGLGGSSDFTQIKKDDFMDQPIEEIKKEEDQSAPVQSAPTPPEVTAEIRQEPTSEISQEGIREVDELTSEFKKL